jgi:hypothetical protein
MRRPEPGGEIPREVTQPVNVLRESLPLARAILWKPLPDAYHLLASMMRGPEDQASLFVSQRAFLQVERHLRSGLDLELGGFLAGQLYECPRTRAHYAVVNTVVPFADVSEAAIGSRVTQEAFDTVQKRLSRHGLSLIGWYRSGNGLGLQLLPDDVDTHMTYFGEPWQTTMIVVQTPKSSKGAFFTYDPRVGRSYCIPFYELFDTRAVEANSLNRTCVSWASYVAAAPVQPLPVAEQEIVETIVTPIRPAPPEPEPPEPIDEWWEAIKDPWIKLKDVAAKTAQRHERGVPLARSRTDRPSKSTPNGGEPTVPPPVVQERRPPAAPEARPPSRPIAPPPLFSVPKPSVSPSVQGTATRAAPPFAGPPRPMPRPAPPAPAASEIAPVDRPVAPAADRATTPASSRSKPPRQIPAATAEAMLRATASSAVALPPDFHDEAMRWQRRRRIGFTVAAASFLAVIVLSTVRARTSGSAQAPVANVSAVVASTALPAAPENGDVIPALPAAVDSLSGALLFYREVEQDHRGGRVGCRVLDKAYVLVGRARTRVDSARGQVAGPLVAADSIRVAMLSAEYTHVAQTYQRSGCTG